MLTSRRTLANRVRQSLIARPFRLAKRFASRVSRRFRSQHSIWSSGKASELNYWSKGFSMGGSDPAVLQYQLDPHAVLAEDIAAYLPDGHEIHILDVGAGPLTRVGKQLPGRKIKITATDALAPEYDDLLQKANIEPLVRTVFCETEHLTQTFEPSVFDVTHARNTLDHHYDAEAALGEMMAVLRPGGRMILWHHENEAHRVRYHGMHQFNFTIEGGNPVLWNRRKRCVLNDLFEGRATLVEARRIVDAEKTFIHIVYEKLGEFEPAIDSITAG